ncbi:MAG TPA: CinA family nicotinamide mononucleotide deamidase-related protein [Bdellovibrionota bacterium]|jgi:nicotinamide-nucleotide amidase
MKSKRPGIFLLTVGDEILDGRIQNTHASWFGEQFRLAGLPVSESRSVSDSASAIAGALKDSSACPVVLVTGGLGPTNDDRTLTGASAAFHLPLVQTKASLQHIRTRYKARNLPLTPTRMKLALVPKGAAVLPNPSGTAPGLHLKVKGTHFFFLPGPPNECRPIFERHVLPFAKKALRGQRILHREFWRTFGRGESEVYNRVSAIVEALEQRFPESVAFGVHISFPYIDLTLEVRQSSKGKRPAAKEIEAAGKDIERALGSLCFSKERESLADAVAKLLKQERMTVASAESCTGGLLGKMLTDASGSSQYYSGGVVSYANSAKETLLGVNKKILQRNGAVSEAAVRVMAESIRKKLGTDFALAISGISGPTGGTEAKPVGTTYVALSTRERTRTMHQVILHGQGSRDQNRVLAAHLALDALRTELLGFHESGIPVN